MKPMPKDAIALLTDDHKEVKALFEQFDALSDRAKSSKKKIALQICHALGVHAQLEEEIFYPAVRAAIKDTDLMDEAQVEHASAKSLISQIEAMDPADDLYDAKVTVLSEQIEHHVKEEERDMFPKAKKSGLDLVSLGAEMQARKEALSGHMA